ncbi:MAG: AAA family ATPase [Tannerella sp.]|jgi:AAA15 family ATPase/GTPase|nr:AAA family ATPase [Tannerella sp.]
MVQIESLNIQNFRGFDNLDIQGFSNINVLLGKNNCGKTSVLEAIFLLSGISNPSLSLNINLMRGIPVSKATLKYIFHNLETANRPSISGIFAQGSTRKLEIIPAFEQNEVSTKADTNAHNGSSSLSLIPAKELSGLDFSFTVKNAHYQTKKFKTGFRFEHNGIKQTLSTNYQEDIISSFLTPDSENADIGLADQLKSLFVARKEHILNELLNHLDPKIKGLYVLQDGLYIDKEGISERTPLRLMGGGVRRFLQIAATIAANKEQHLICLIDEIENGLHHESQQLMWQTLFSLSQSANIQLFITTHSLEMLQSLTNVLKQNAYSAMRDSVKIFTIVNTQKEGYQSYVRSYDGLDLALENDMEIR